MRVLAVRGGGLDVRGDIGEACGVGDGREELFEARRTRAARVTWIGVGLAGLHLLLWVSLWRVLGDVGVALMLAPAAGQAASGVAAVVHGVKLRRVDPSGLARGIVLAAVIVGLVVTIAAPVVWIGGGIKVSLRGLDAIDVPSFASP